MFILKVSLNVILSRGDVVRVHRWASTGHMHIVLSSTHGEGSSRCLTEKEF